ncbi:protein of unknown function [Taphrina deformans PYCC 5710]|uniref:Uncharacterized protein n=1 Tax=Taphrina deformans (strain PYCC 5710 / ATCC 11124 / CBS 356.35 / IMI 108563 / JCM 9778 / NBRC 8474) TaxID=1097556 RepID=R4XAL2_TAPDE|nr:protein of unknown function [Taphrina deformans PYCC 5710]|eukprot:CCG81343.1 protein of unknown function [Taphrina deformans PYCC 5710]
MLVPLVLSSIVVTGEEFVVFYIYNLLIIIITYLHRCHDSESEFLQSLGNQVPRLALTEKLDLSQDLHDEDDDLFLVGLDPDPAIHAHHNLVLDLVPDELERDVAGTLEPGTEPGGEAVEVPGAGAAVAVEDAKAAAGPAVGGIAPEFGFHCGEVTADAGVDEGAGSEVRSTLAVDVVKGEVVEGAGQGGTQVHSDVDEAPEEEERRGPARTAWTGRSGRVDEEEDEDGEGVEKCRPGPIFEVGYGKASPGNRIVPVSVDMMTTLSKQRLWFGKRKRCVVMSGENYGYCGAREIIAHFFFLVEHQIALLPLTIGINMYGRWMQM